MSFIKDLLGNNSTSSAIGTALLNYYFPDAASSVGSWLGAGDNSKAVGDALFGAGVGALTGGGRGALAGGLSGFGVGGGGEMTGQMLGVDDPSKAAILGNTLLGAGSGAAGGSGALKGALVGGGLTALAQHAPQSLAPSPNALTGQAAPTAAAGTETSPALAPTQAGGLQGGLEGVKKFVAAHPTMTAALIMALTNQGKQTMAAKPQPLPAFMTAHAPSYTMNRTVTVPKVGGNSYFSYGQAPEDIWFGGDSTPKPEAPQMAQGGLSRLGDASMGPAQPSRYVQGPGTGRSDDIPARLSNNEYVIDAETVSMLGDGSPDAGAKKLDELRARVRSHKGKALAKGKMSPDAKHPLAYLKGAK